jgi:hypothetical protein
MEWKNSKENTDYVVKKITSILVKTKIEPTILGNTLSAFHLFASGVLLLIICFFKKINSLFYCALLVWLLVIASNYYFHGCILTRIERELYNSKEWFGPVTLLLRLLNIEQTKENANWFMKYAIAAPFSVIMLFTFGSTFSKGFNI